MKRYFGTIMVASFLLSSCGTSVVTEETRKNILTEEDFKFGKEECIEFTLEREESLDDKFEHTMRYKVDGAAIVDLSTSPFKGKARFAKFMGIQYLETLNNKNIPVSRSTLAYERGKIYYEEATYNEEMCVKTSKGSFENGDFVIGSPINTDIFKDYESNKEHFLVYDDDNFYRLMSYREKNRIVKYSISKVYESYTFEEIIFDENKISCRTSYSVMFNTYIAFKPKYNDIKISEQKFDTEFKIHELNFDWPGVKKVLFS